MIDAKRLTREQIESMCIAAARIKPGRLAWMPISASHILALCDMALESLRAQKGMEPAIKPTHEAADAFWNYWKANGETHKHGYYESTWGAINAALRTSGIVMHDYAAAQSAPLMSKADSSPDQAGASDELVRRLRYGVISYSLYLEAADHIEALERRIAEFGAALRGARERAEKAEAALKTERYPDTEADGWVFCGKCGARR